MTHDRLIRVLGTAALVLAATAAPATAVLLGDVNGVCKAVPQAAATKALTFAPDDPLPGTANCSSLCTKWLGACKASVAALQSCWNTTIGKMFNMRKAECNTDPSPVLAAQCVASFEAQRDDLKNVAHESADLGRADCEDPGLPTCLASCD